MSQVKAFTVGAKTYNAAMVSAVKQDELLSMLTAPLTQRALAAAQVGKVVGDELVSGMLMSMEYSIKSKIADMLMTQVFIAGTQVPVTIDDFSGRMVEYNQLLARLLMWNLGDFSQWLSSVVAPDATQPQPPENIVL